MKDIINLLIALSDLIEQVVKFVINLFSDLIYCIGLMGSFLVNIPDYFSFLPDTCIALIVTTFSIVIVYKVCNRE